MYRLMSLPLSSGSLAEYGGAEELRRELRALGCHGVEAIWAGGETPGWFPRELAVGYHLSFYPDWLDFYREDRSALLRKFGSLEAVRSFYGGWGADHLLAFYRADLERSRALGASYVVFHVSDVSVEEGFTYRRLHSDAEVIDASAEIVNLLLGAEDGGFDLLLENQWWPGFTMTDPDLTARLLAAVRYPRAGIMLDTGHLMNANPSLTTEAEGAAYIHRMLDGHGDLCRRIRGVHLHQSLSGDYVRRCAGRLPPLPEDYGGRYAASYQHITRIDRHDPWSDGAAAGLVERVGPRYLVHELTGRDRAARFRAVQRQLSALSGR